MIFDHEIYEFAPTTICFLFQTFFYFLALFFSFFFTFQLELYDATDKKKQKEEEAAKKKAEIEKQKERERKKYIRPWDKEKASSSSKRNDSSSDSEEETEWKPQKEYRPMSQGKLNLDGSWSPVSFQHFLISSDEWNEKQRAERKQEFAPMTANFVRSDETYNPNTVYEEEKNEKSLFFSTKPKLKRRNLSPEASQQNPETNLPKGAAIPPPATFDYYGPTSSKHTKPAAPAANLEDSISAGLKFLREQVDKGNKHKWSVVSDYTNNGWLIHVSTHFE